MAVGRQRPAAQIEGLLDREVGQQQDLRGAGRLDREALSEYMPQKPHGILTLARRQGPEADGIELDLAEAALRDLDPLHVVVVAVLGAETHGRALG
jgi:hypothetical protein